MRIFNSIGEKLYQEWVLKFCAKETKGQGEVPYHLLESSETSTNLYGTDTPDRNHWNGPCPNKEHAGTDLRMFEQGTRGDRPSHVPSAIKIIRPIGPGSRQKFHRLNADFGII